jgi:hypothetical protein
MVSLSVGFTAEPLKLDDYLLPRWGQKFPLDIEAGHIEEWLDALELENPTKEKIRRAMNVVYRRGQKCGRSGGSPRPLLLFFVTL